LVQTNLDLDAETMQEFAKRLLRENGADRCIINGHEFRAVAVWGG
jgi:hypothetical protein